ncbi:hypothetical protein Tco_1056084, partial [Tanacetum coccineum]
MTSVPNSTELELTALQSGRSRSALVKDPEPPSVPPTKKQVDDLFQWFDDDEVVPIPPVVPITPVNVPAAPAPENANGSPSTTVISEGAPAVTESLLPHQIPLPDTSDSDVETLFDHVDSNVFDTYNAPKTDSEASHSNSVNIDVTPNNQLPHVQKWTQAHPLENIIGDKDRPVSTRKQLETDAMWCFFNEFLTHVEPKNFRQALEHSCWIEAMQEEIHEFERLDVWILVPCPDNILIIPLKWKVTITSVLRITSTLQVSPRSNCSCKELQSNYDKMLLMEAKEKGVTLDTQDEIILSQGLPRHIFNNLNQTSTAKEIWDNVELLMQGLGRTLQQRKDNLFDEYERFRAIGNESIHDYFVSFHKLVNDMKITQLNILTHQMNTKFVNNLPAYWGK